MHTVKFFNKYGFLVLCILLGSHFLPLTVLGQKSQGIGTNTPNPRAVLDLTVEQPVTYPQGLLLPRLTTVQRTLLSTSLVTLSATGMAVYDTDDFNFYTWNGTSWVSVGSSNSTTITGTNTVTITTIPGGFNINVPYISIVGINGVVVTSAGASFSVSGQNIISSQWTTTGNNIYYNQGNVSIGLTASGAALSILQDAGVKPALQLLGGATKSVFLELGRGSTDATIGVAGNASTISGLANSGDLVIKANALNSSLILSAKNAGGNITLSTGLADNLLMFISTSVGIGTNAPSAMLDVNGGARIRALSVTGSVLTVDGLGNVGMGIISSSAPSWQLGGNNLTGLTTTTLGTISNHPLVFVTNNTEYMRIDQFGKIGIGTSTPGQALDIVGQNPGAALRVNTAPFGGSPFAIEAFNNTSNNFTIQSSNGYSGAFAGAGKFVITNAANTSAALYASTNSSGTGLAFDALGKVRLESYNISGSVLTVDGLGNVGMGTIATSANYWSLTGSNYITTAPVTAIGIGTTSPGTALEVYASSLGGISLKGSTSSNPVAYKLGFNGAGYNGYVGIVNGANDWGASGFGLAGDMVIGSGSGGKLIFGYGSSPAMIQNGNLGLGGTYPSATLDVKGTVRFENLSVTGAVLTVDGAGNVGIGTISYGSSQWITTTTGIYVNTFVGIGNINPANLLSVQDIYLSSGGSNYTSSKFDITHRAPNAINKAFQLNYSAVGTGGTMQFTGIEVNMIGRPNVTAFDYVPAYSAIFGVTGSGNMIGFQSSVSGTSTGKKIGFDANVQGTGGTQNIGINITVSGATNNYAALLNGGNVGIGTSTPNQTLVVAGNTSITGISYLSSTVGIGVNTFTGFEALRIGGVNPSSPKGIVFPYITTVQMAAITAAGLGPLDAGMGFYVTEYKNVTIWDGTQFSSTGGNNNNNNNSPGYNWDIYGSVTLGGTNLSATGFGRLGTFDNYGILVQTNNQPRMFIPASTLVGITMGMGNFLQTVTSTLAVKGDIGLGDGISTNNGNVVVWLTNSNGSAIVQGSIVVVGTSDDSFNTTTTASDNSVIGVLTENCLSGNSCKVAVSGVVTVNVNGGSTRGQHCVTSIVAGQALSVPVPNAGASIGVFLQTTGGTSARVLLR